MSTIGYWCIPLSVSRPIKWLRENFKVVANGNFNLQVPATGKSELDDLARAFNDMTDKLRKSYAEVEDRVRVRTKELQLATVRSKKLAEAAMDPSIPEIVFTDATRLHQVLNNLISNALKFTEEGSIEVKAWCGSSGGDDLYHISVRDTGIGIARDKLEDVFVAFTQADSSTTRKYGGTGLGLAISKRLVEMLEGEISVESVEGKGSAFSFSFRDLAHLYEGDDDASVSEDMANKGFDFEGALNVLVAEDDPANFKLTSKLLKRLNITPDWAKNGRQAVKMTGEKNYHLILMDLQMPELDGYSAAREILEAAGEGEEPYIAALTANALGESRQHCEEAGMKDFLSKPVSGEDIRAALIRYRKATQAEV